MKTIIRTLIFIVIMLSGQLFSQEIDSLSSEFSDLSLKEKYIHYSKLLDDSLENRDKFEKNYGYSKKIIKISKKLNNEEKIAKSYYYLGKTYFENFNDSLAVSNLRKSLKYDLSSDLNIEIRTMIAISLRSLKRYNEAIYENNILIKIFEYQNGPFPEYFDALNANSGNYKLLGFYSKALDCCMQAENLIPKLPEELKKSSKEKCLIRFGEINYRLKNIDKALNYFEKALELAKENDSTYRINICYNNIANIYSERKEFYKARDYYEKSTKFNLKNKIESELAVNYFNLAYVYFDLKNYDLALEYSLKSKNISKDYKQVSTKVKNSILMSMLFSKLKMQNKLEKQIEKLKIESENKGNSNEDLLRIFNYLSSYYQENNNDSLNLKFLKKAFNYKEQILLNLQNEKIKTIASQYELEDEIQKRKNLELKSKKLKRNVILASVFLSVIILLLVIEGKMKRKRIKSLKIKNALIKEQKIKLNSEHKKLIEAERKNTALAMFVTASHEINQPLTILSGNWEMLKMMTSQERIDEKQKKYVLKIDYALERIKKLSDKYRNLENIKLTSYSKNTDMFDLERKEDE